MSASKKLQGLSVIGKRHDTEWNVIELLEVKPGNTPGQFSVGYIVEDGKRNRGFLKASDLSMFVQDSGSVLDAFNRATTAHAFERDVLEYCHGNAMDRIVTAIDYGELEVTNEGVRDFVFFLIFELAKGDLRSHVTTNNDLDLLWAATALHNVFVATAQLHSAKIAHNDLKPANALIIDAEIQKVADLGRATSSNHPAAHDTLLCTGDQRFAPPEQLYPTDLTCAHIAREEKRKVGDLYNLGSLAYFMVTSRMLTPEIVANVRPELRPRNGFGGSQDSYQAALPYWNLELARLLGEYVQLGIGRFGPGVNDELISLKRMVSKLCEPDPLRRGHPQNRLGHQDPLSLNRYISELNSIKNKLKVKAA